MHKTGIFFLLLLLFACNSGEQKSDAYGNFETDEVLVASEAGGKILQMKVQQGASVKLNDVICIIDTSNIVLQIDQLLARKNAVLSQKKQLRAQNDITRQQIQNLQTDIDRLQKLFADGAATQKQLDDADGQLQVMQKKIVATNVQLQTVDAQAQEIDANIAVQQKRLDDCTVTSPMNGSILEKYVEQGELTSPGKTIVKMANTSTLDLRVFISGKQLEQARVGAEVEVLTDGASSLVKDKGTITWISSQSEFTPKVIQTRDERVDMVYAMKIRVENKDGKYKIGMPGEINFLPKE